MRHIFLSFALLVNISALAQPSPDDVIGIAARGETVARRAALDEGAEPDAIGTQFNNYLEDQTTPLIEAIRSNHVEVVEMLLDAGANPFAPDDVGRMPLWYAADVGSVEIARLLLEFDADIEEGSDGGTTPLAWAAYSDRTELVAFLLDSGANLSARDNNNNSVLGRATNPHGKSFGNARTVALLLARGAELSVPNVRGFTPLHMAVHISPSSLLLTHLLLEAGADPNAPDAIGQTVLHLAVSYEMINIVETLIDGGADLNSANGDGMTALQIARGYDLSEISDLLTEAGATE